MVLAPWRFWNGWVLVEPSIGGEVEQDRVSNMCGEVGEWVGEYGGVVGGVRRPLVVEHVVLAV